MTIGLTRLTRRVAKSSPQIARWSPGEAHLRPSAMGRIYIYIYMYCNVEKDLHMISCV